MSTVAQFVDQVDGVSDDVAEALAGRYDTVEDLSQAPTADLQEVKGVGPVLADRILQSARAEVADTRPVEQKADQLSDRTREAIADAAEAARPVLGVVEDAAGDVSSGREVDVEPEDLPRVVVRLATWVGTTVGWTIRAYRTVTTPVTRLLRRA